MLEGKLKETLVVFDTVMGVISAEVKQTLSLKHQGKTHFSVGSPEAHLIICSLMVWRCRIMGKVTDCF